MADHHVYVPRGCPSPEQIAAECALIRAEWDEATHRARWHADPRLTSAKPRRPSARWEPPLFHLPVAVAAQIGDQ